MRCSRPSDRLDCGAGVHTSREMRLSGAPGGPQPREGRFFERTAPWAVERLPRKGCSTLTTAALDSVAAFGLAEPFTKVTS